MRYAAKLLIPSRRLAVINGYLNAEQEDEFQGEDNTIIHTVSFPDGKFMDIKCCGCQDECSPIRRHRRGSRARTGAPHLQGCGNLQHFRRLQDHRVPHGTWS